MKIKLLTVAILLSSRQVLKAQTQPCDVWEAEQCCLMDGRGMWKNDTLYYKLSEHPSVFDTIPHMYADRYFMEAYNEMMEMLRGARQPDLKRAEFLVEWAFLEGAPDYASHCHAIDSVVQTLRQFIQLNGLKRYRSGVNYALFDYFTKPSPLNDNRAFSYDFEDFAGNKDFTKLFITKVMRTHSGQCTSLPLYYKILCDELGGQSALALAPSHMFVKHIGEDGRWVNVELTNGHTARDEWIIQKLGVSVEAIRHGTFLCALTEQQNIALMLVHLASAYKQKYGNYDYFTLRCADGVLSCLPDFCEALVLQECTHQAFGFAYLDRFGQRPGDFISWNYARYKQAFDRLNQLGYTQVGEEQYGIMKQKEIEQLESKAK